MQTFDGNQVNEGDVIYTVTSAPAHGKWGGYVHASAWRVEKTANGKKFKLVNVWTGNDFTSSVKAWQQAKRNADKPEPTKRGGKRILANRAGRPTLVSKDGDTQE